jgi:hypothetical protein
MIVSDDEMVAIQNYFPDLYLNEKRSRILGELSFGAFYDGTKLHLNPSDQKGSEVFHGYYEIEIRLNRLDIYGLPVVFEKGCKINKFSQENNIRPIDLHLNKGGSCCLGIFTPGESTNMTIYKFIVEIIFSYFAWQAYALTYKKKAPWGEYSHTRGFREKRNDILINMQTSGRNDTCPCGSGLKYKNCCLDQFQHFTRRIQ